MQEYIRCTILPWNKLNPPLCIYFDEVKQLFILQKSVDLVAGGGGGGEGGWGSHEVGLWIWNKSNYKNLPKATSLCNDVRCYKQYRAFTV